MQPILTDVLSVGQSVSLSRMHRMTPHSEADLSACSACGGHSVQPLPNDFGLTFTFIVAVQSSETETVGHYLHVLSLSMRSLRPIKDFENRMVTSERKYHRKTKNLVEWLQTITWLGSVMLQPRLHDSPGRTEVEVRFLTTAYSDSCGLAAYIHLPSKAWWFEQLTTAISATYGLGQTTVCSPFWCLSQLSLPSL